jgi:hypothetical protein
LVSGDELVAIICKLVTSMPGTIPISLMNHSPEMAREIIVEVLDYCAKNNCPVNSVHVDPELAELLKINVGQTITKNAAAIYVLEEGLGRQVKFVRAPQ